MMRGPISVSTISTVSAYGKSQASMLESVGRVEKRMLWEARKKHARAPIPKRSKSFRLSDRSSLSSVRTANTWAQIASRMRKATEKSRHSYPCDQPFRSSPAALL